MKRETYWRNIRLSNDILYYIYTHIETDINLDELADTFRIDKFYLHKIFKSVFGFNIYESIKSIRLQKASNLLITNRMSTITEIANACGYASHSSFVRAFRQRFNMTPGAWRRGGYADYSRKLLHLGSEKSHTLQVTGPEICRRDAIKAWYLRDQGYGEHIKKSWQKIQTVVYALRPTSHTLISLFHDNPAITPLPQCQHVSAVMMEGISQKPNLPYFHISEGVYAKFGVRGTRDDLLYFIRWVYHDWLVHSGYETTTTPPYAIYRKNHHINEEERFEMDFFLSVKL
jgi:AraC family transcriptional regulator